MMAKVPKILSRLETRLDNWRNQQRLIHMARQIATHARSEPDQAPVIFFNASTRLSGLSQNAAFNLLTSWGLRLAGSPVIHFVCQAGMSHCVLGTNRQDYAAPPPCTACVAQSQNLYSGAQTHWFTYHADPDLAQALRACSVDELSAFTYPAPFSSAGSDPAGEGLQIPLGALVLPSIRWALRRHHLPDDEPTRYLLREYMLSAYRVAQEFAVLLEQAQPAVVVLFNGMMYPEATAHWVASQYGVRTLTHEVSFQKFSAFFTEGQATAYPLHIPEAFQLTPVQNARLDGYLEQRFKGKFTMAGIQFWPEMRALDESFLQKASDFRQIVSVFTNVVFDTSQVHANVLFPHMFAWLDLILDIIRAHPDTLFVIRAHPDEMRPGSAKKSRESVHDWVQRNGVDRLPNVVFIPSQEYVSSYDLIRRSKFVMVYNSSIGLEATLLGAVVLCGGKARYTQYPIVFFPDTPEAYRELAEDFLDNGVVEIPAEFQANARRFLYYQLYCASLPFEAYLQPGKRPGFVHLQDFSWRQLLPENSPTIQVLVAGILNRAQSGDSPDGKTILLGECHERGAAGKD
ncbi:MAG: hypothetical protein P8074_16280 [Anaerolineales bacterium]